VISEIKSAGSKENEKTSDEHCFRGGDGVAGGRKNFGRTGGRSGKGKIKKTKEEGKKKGKVSLKNRQEGNN